MNKILSKIISFLLTPLMVPTYSVFIAMSVTLLCLIPLQVRLAMTLFICLITCAVPFLGIYLLYRLKVVSDFDVSDRKERLYPLIITSCSYVAAAFLLFQSNAPVWLTNLMWGAFAASIVTLLITLRWKISAHTAGMGGLIGMCFRIISMNLDVNSFQMAILTAIVIIIAGIVGTARIYLEKHTLSQVLAGYANGFICVYFIMGIH